MDDRLWFLIPLLPLVSGLLVGTRLFGGARWSEPTMSGAVLLALGTSFLGSVAAFVTSLGGTRDVVVGTWLRSGSYHVDLGLRLDPAGAAFAAFAMGLTLGVAWVSTRYMHRETGFVKLYALLGVFAGGMSLFALAGNLVLAFVGWELAGACSVLLIAFYPGRATSADGGLRAYLTNKVGDAAFLVLIAGVAATTGAPDLAMLPQVTGAWALVLAIAAVLAGSAKAGLVPFTPWLGRAIEGPTPTSALFYGAVMVNAGVFLAVRATPLLDTVPAVRGLVVLIGLLSLVGGQLASRAQSDVKSGLVLAGMSHTGLAFALVGAGLPGVGLAYAIVHGSLRAVQVLFAPSWLSMRRLHAVRPAPAWLAARPAWQLAAADRFWLEELHDAWVARPVMAVAGVAEAIERSAVQPLTGVSVPALEVASALAEREEAHLEWLAAQGDVDRARGLVGSMTAAMAHAAHAVEDVVIGGWIGRKLPTAGAAAGARLDALEVLLQRPLVVVGVVVATLLVVAGGA